MGDQICGFFIAIIQKKCATYAYTNLVDVKVKLMYGNLLHRSHLTWMNCCHRLVNLENIRSFYFGSFVYLLAYPVDFVPLIKFLWQVCTSFKSLR